MENNDKEKQPSMPRVYTPKEVAEMFGISENALKSRRQRGQIEGTVLNNRMVVYTEEQVKRANLSQRKRGPKPKSKPREEEPEDSKDELLCFA